MWYYIQPLQIVDSAAGGLKASILPIVLTFARYKNQSGQETMSLWCSAYSHPPVSAFDVNI